MTSEFDRWAEKEDLRKEAAASDPLRLAQVRCEETKEAWRTAVQQGEAEIARIRAGIALQRLAMDNARQALAELLPKRPRGRPAKER